MNRRSRWFQSINPHSVIYCRASVVVFTSDVASKWWNLKMLQFNQAASSFSACCWFHLEMSENALRTGRTNIVFWAPNTDFSSGRLVGFGEKQLWLCVWQQQWVTGTNSLTHTQVKTWRGATQSLRIDEGTYTYCSLRLYWKASEEMNLSLQDVTVLEAEGDAPLTGEQNTFSRKWTVWRTDSCKGLCEDGDNRSVCIAVFCQKTVMQMRNTHNQTSRSWIS